MALDFSDLVPKKQAKKLNGLVSFLNRSAHIPKKVLDFLPKLGEGLVRTAATLPTTAFSRNPSAKLPAAKNFVREPFREGGKSLPERAIELQVQGEQTLPEILKPIARALGPVTAAGAQLAAGFGDPLNLALGYGAMLRSPNVSVAEAVLGSNRRPTVQTEGKAIVSPTVLRSYQTQAADQIQRDAPEVAALVRKVSLRGVRSVPEAESVLLAALPENAPATARTAISNWARSNMQVLDFGNVMLPAERGEGIARVAERIPTGQAPKASPFTLLRMRDFVASKLPSSLRESVSRVSMRGARTVDEAERRLLASLPEETTEGVRALITEAAQQALREAPPQTAMAPAAPDPLVRLADVFGPPAPVPVFDEPAFRASLEPRLPTPSEAKARFRADQRGFRQAMEDYNLRSSNEQPYGPIPAGTTPRPTPPKAPAFKNVLPPGKKPIIPEPPGSSPFPLEELRTAPVRDRSPFAYQRETLDRNIEDTFGAAAPRVRDYLSEPLKRDLTSATELASRVRQELENIFRGVRIRRGSKEDFLAADFIEGKVTLEELGKVLTKNRVQAIQTAADAGRLVYKELLRRINGVLKAYGYKPVAERQNYVTHTRQMGAFLDRLGSFLSGGRDTLPTEISAMNVDTKPGRQFFAFGKRRKYGSTHEGLITALDKYIDPAVRQIHLTPTIQRFRAFQRALVKLLPEQDSTRLSNFHAYLEQLTNMLAGKQNIIDRPIEKVFGRKFLRVFDGLRRRTGANLVGGSVSAALTNYIPLTQSLATTSKPAAVRALFEALAVPFKDPAVIDGIKSAFLTRRFPKVAIAPKLTTRAKDAVSWLFRVVDQFTANTVVGGKYYEGLRNGLSKADAMKAADDYAARLLADRSFGQQPLFFNSKTLGALTQFQVEVNNQLSFILKDVPRTLKLNRRQVASALTQVALYSYLFNEFYERTVGRRPALDPVHAVVNLVGRVGEGADATELLDPTDQNTPVGEIVAALPFTSIAAGGRIPIGGSLPNLIGILSGDATLTQELQKPLFALLPPTGGAQARKTIKGLQAFNQGYSETPSGRLRFFIDEGPLNAIRSALFGEYATPQAREYFRNR
uniref:Large polyvalent protein associated domain-containing protein n=1 Tax=Eiseniibacteriota bacterium TaxID=2212470 RepID=A0A832I2X2_UNCEI